MSSRKSKAACSCGGFSQEGRFIHAETCGDQTRVVNLQHASWHVYIGRRGRGFDGYFGNPYVVGKVCQRCGSPHLTPGATLPCFKDYFYERLLADVEFRKRVKTLKGKRLGCFCKPGPCHGDIIMDYLEGA